MLQTELADKRSQHLSGFDLFKIESFDGRLNTTDGCTVGMSGPAIYLGSLIGLGEGIEGNSIVAVRNVASGDSPCGRRQSSGDVDP